MVDEEIISSIQNAKENTSKLGIEENIEGISTPRCGKQLENRGRKLMAKLRKTLGKEGNQKKIHKF